MATFYDHFSGHAELYNRHRPTYPDALYAWLAGQTEGHDLAVDCATGGGQAAAGLAQHYRRVVASDASPQQLASAKAHDRVCYLLAAAEALPLEGGCADLVTVAQAFHWLDASAFAAEVKRIGSPGSVVAVWCYRLFTIDPAVDEVMGRFYHGRLDPYWPPERAHVRDAYQRIPFPFHEIATPTFAIEHLWTPADLLAQVSTWSGVRRHDHTTGLDAVALLSQEIAEVWPDSSESRPMRWDISVRAGRIHR